MTGDVISTRIFTFGVWLSVALTVGLPGVFAQKPSDPGPTPLDPHKPVERAMSGGDIHAYRISLEAGQFLRAVVEQRGIDVVVTVVGPAGERLAEVDSPTGTSGAETVELAVAKSGIHRLEVRPWEDPTPRGTPEEPSGRYEIRLEELLTAEQYAAHLSAERAKVDRVIAWLSDHAIRLRTVEPGRGFDDMRPLADVIGDACIVALGEATHGTREFFQLKHRMLEFLVSEMDFTVFAIEATMPEAFDVNEYVLTGEGDPAKALAGLYFWTWNTEEVLDLIEWMRLYNADPTHERKVKFYGFDMQFVTRAAKVTLDYLRAVDSEQLMVAEPALGALANPYTDGFVGWSEDRKEAAALAIEQILRRLEDHGSEYIAETDSMSWALARQHAEIVAQYIERMSRIGTAGGFAVRDSAMAENVRWILEREGPQAKLVLWAHNSHVSTQPPSMGAHLRGTFGSDMVVFGFAFNQGSFQAVERGQPSKGGLRSFTVEPAPEGSLGWVLAEAGLQLAAVDLREPPEDGPVAEWWNEPRPVREVGAGYSEGSPSGFWAPRILPDFYDALLFVESTTPARSNPGGRLLGWTLLETPQNLDFEDSKPGEIPRGWLSGSLQAPWTAVPERQQDFDFHVLTTEDRSYRGERSGMIFRPAGRHYGEVLGTLGQRIEAEGYRGKRVRLRAAVRAEVSGPGNEAYLWVRVTKAYAFPPSIAFRDDRSITHDEWREYEIVGEVPPDAEVIDFGLALVGEGRAWIDTVALEAVDEE